MHRQQRSKRSIRFLIGIISIISSTYAQDLTLRTDSTRYDINDTITATIRLESEQNQGGNIAIEWLWSFDIVWQSQSTSYRSINGNTLSTLTMVIKLIAEQPGVYTIGPVQLESGTGTITSNHITIEITGEKLFVGQVDPSVQQQLQTQTIEEADSNSPQENKQPSWQRDSEKLWLLSLFLFVWVVIITRLHKRKRSDHTLNPENTPKDKSFSLPVLDHPWFLVQIEQYARFLIGELLDVNAQSLAFDEIIHHDSYDILTTDQQQTIQQIIHLLEQLIYAHHDTKQARQQLITLLTRLSSWLHQ